MNNINIIVIHSTGKIKWSMFRGMWHGVQDIEHFIFWGRQFLMLNCELLPTSLAWMRNNLYMCSAICIRLCSNKLAHIPRLQGFLSS